MDSHFPGNEKTAVRDVKGQLYQGAVHLRVADAKLVDGDVISVAGVGVDDPPPAVADLSAAADICRTEFDVERRVRAVVDILVRVLQSSFPMTPRNHYTTPESGDHPFCSI